MGRTRLTSPSRGDTGAAGGQYAPSGAQAEVDGIVQQLAETVQRVLQEDNKNEDVAKRRLTLGTAVHPAQGQLSRTVSYARVLLDGLGQKVAPTRRY